MAAPDTMWSGRGSSPRWRGRRCRCGTRRRSRGLIPALAGTTWRSPHGHGRPGAHPRAGGDDRRGCGWLWRLMGSSPRWRGRPRIQHTEHVRERLIPALAGTTDATRAGEYGAEAHPRAGGDDRDSRASTTSSAGSSPRWRGRQAGWGRERVRGGLIPALAGTTTVSRRARSRRGAHPRAGGDDRPDAFRGLCPHGSSPRWRGRPSARQILRFPHGLIPALAGTT